MQDDVLHQFSMNSKAFMPISSSLDTSVCPHEKKMKRNTCSFWMHSFGRNFSIQMNFISEKNYGFPVHTNCLLPTIFESYHLVSICFQGLCCLFCTKYGWAADLRMKKTNNMHKMIHRFFFQLASFQCNFFLSSSWICTKKLQTRAF